MSTIASPRAPSLASSSRRTSTSTDTTVRSTSTSRAPAPATPRRNRVALRDYYGLKSAAPAGSIDSKDSLALEEKTEESELDKPGFDAEQHVRNVLARENLEGVLRVEAGLVSEIRGFDGERKALVYDNYSKLIGATDTIRRMRTNMDPLIPTTSTLEPALSHIAETAATLSTSLKGFSPSDRSENERQRSTVRWVLKAPDRMRKFYAQDMIDEARSDWQRVAALLDKWKDVQGVQEVRSECEAVMRDASGP